MKVLIGVSGSISAYKSVEIMRDFQRMGHEVSVILTRNAQRFIQPLTFDTFIPGRVHGEWFANGQDPLLHINLGKTHELMLIAPATANCIGKMAAGIADDLLSSVFLAFGGRVVVAPAMNDGMLAHPAVQRNIAALESMGVELIRPASGELACGTSGSGRLPDPSDIVAFCLGAERV